jgi:hypothetical protein
VVTSGSRLRVPGALLALAAAALVPAGAGVHRQRHWCKAGSSAAWRRVLERHVVPLSRKVSLDPWALAHDGRSFFATVHSPSFSGVARIDVPTGRMTEIKAFPDPAQDQADGAFDGRWLVWDEYHGLESFDDFTVWAWDSRGGEARQIGTAARDFRGEPWPSPWRRPDVRAGIATWAQGSGADQLTDVHAYDLRTSEDRVVRSGHAQGPFLLRNHVVVWPESPSRGAATRMYAASAVTGVTLTAPLALRGLNGVSGLATDGDRIAYPDGLYRSLWWSPSLSARPRRIVATTHAYDYVDNSVEIGGRYIGFGIQPRVFVGDMRARRYVQITAQGGWTRVDARSLLVLYATRSKAVDARSAIAFVRLRDLPPIPACP